MTMKRTFFFLAAACLCCSAMAQDYTQAYIMGGATPNGWDAGKSLPMKLVSSGEGSALFSWTGELTAGDFKLSNRAGDWYPCFNAPTENEPVVLGQEHRLVYHETAGDADYKFMLQEEGLYTVTADLKRLTLSVVRAEMPDELWITGSSVPGGSAKLSNLPPEGSFMYVGELQLGELKFMTSAMAGDGTEYLVPVAEYVDITGTTDCMATTDVSLPGWEVWVADPVYKIKVDFSAKRVEAGVYQSRDMLYMVGGAVETGWSANLALPFVRDEQNPDLFVFDGELKVRPQYEEPDRFKILGQLDWDPYSLHPYEMDELLPESGYVRVGGDDTKWKVDEGKQGRYVITVNTLYETIEARYVPEDTSVEGVEAVPGWFVALSCEGGVRVRTNEGRAADVAQLFGMDGRLLQSAYGAGTDFVLGEQLPAGVYILKVGSGKLHGVQRVLVK